MKYYKIRNNNQMMNRMNFMTNILIVHSMRKSFIRKLWNKNIKLLNNIILTNKNYSNSTINKLNDFKMKMKNKNKSIKRIKNLNDIF